jgi:hypothetical protein
MQDLKEELLVPPSPFVALVGDAAFLDILAVSLKTAAAPGSSSSSSGSMVHVRYEPAAFPLQFPSKERSHSDAEYATYIPDGILRREWMDRHHNSSPAVLVSDERLKLARPPLPIDLNARPSAHFPCANPSSFALPHPTHLLLSPSLCIV